MTLNAIPPDSGLACLPNKDRNSSESNNAQVKIRARLIGPVSAVGPGGHCRLGVTYVGSTHHSGGGCGVVFLVPYDRYQPAEF